MCDRHGCDEPGDRPAPKSPNSPERWYFCERHAAEYNRNWNYFEGLTAEDAAAREAEEQQGANGFRQAGHYGWGGPGDGSRSRDEMRALDMLELEADAGFRGRSRPPIAASPRPTIPTSSPATPRPPAASRRSRRPMTCCARPRSGAASPEGPPGAA